MSEQRTLQVRRGNTFGFDMRMKEPDGTPINLTGHAMEFVVGLGAGDTFRKAFTIDDAVAGKLSLRLTVEEVNAFDIKRHPFEVIYTAGGEVRTIIIGYLLVTQWVGSDG